MAWLSSIFRRSAGRFRRERSGVAALEFALVSPIFFLILFAYLELGVLMIRTLVLDSAVSQASRFIYTGQAVTEEDLETFICANVALITDCEDNIQIESTVIGTFQDPPTTDAPCVDAQDPDFDPASEFNTGGSSEIVFLRVCITSDLLLPWYGLGASIEQTDTGRVQLISSLAFSNEPF